MVGVTHVMRSEAVIPPIAVAVEGTNEYCKHIAVWAALVESFNAAVGVVAVVPPVKAENFCNQRSFSRSTPVVQDHEMCIRVIRIVFVADPWIENVGDDVLASGMNALDVIR